MSNNWVWDMERMHGKYGVRDVIETFDKEKLTAFLKFRIDFLQEELDEMKDAENAEDLEKLVAIKQQMT